jgi:hypothetical protein
VLVSSRSFAEYVAMFDLDAEQLRGASVLDCAAGAASFVAEASSTYGANAAAVDPAYALDRDELTTTVRASIESGAAIADQFADRFTWDWYGSPEARDVMRKTALSRFLVDLVSNPQRYRAGSLPSLPFADGEFALALCSHLLFTWADELGCDWHFAAIEELSRVAGEVRIFPTLVQGAGDPVPFWNELMQRLADAGMSARKRCVDYEFQVGGNEMLVVTAAATTPSQSH